MAQVSVRPAPGDSDIDLADSTLAWRTARIQRALKNAAWELWRNRLATVGAVMVLDPVSGGGPTVADRHP